jgi:hypothetical protein
VPDATTSTTSTTVPPTTTARGRRGRCRTPGDVPAPVPVPPAANAVPTHVVLEIRLTAAEADDLAYWLGRLEDLIRTGTATDRRDGRGERHPGGNAIGRGEAADAVARVRGRLAGRVPAGAGGRVRR